MQCILYKITGKRSFHRKTGDDVAPVNRADTAVKSTGILGADGKPDGFRSFHSDDKIILPSYSTDDIGVKLMPANLNQLRKNNSAKRQNGDLGCVIADIHDKDALGSLHINSKTKSVGQSLLYDHDAPGLNAGILDQVIECAPLYLCDIRRNGNKEICRMQRSPLLIAHEGLHQKLHVADVRDHTVSDGIADADVCGSSLEHLICIVSVSNHGLFVFDRNHVLLNHDFIGCRIVYFYVAGSKIHGIGVVYDTGIMKFFLLTYIAVSPASSSK